MSGVWNAFIDMFDTATIASIVAGASALMFATMGETISEKAGVINLSVDGSMMLAALGGFVVAFETGNVWLGFPAAAAVGVAVALIVALGSIKLSLNQVAVGFVLFALCTELSRFLGNSYVGRLPVGVPSWGIPGLKSIPFFGPVLFAVVINLSLSRAIDTANETLEVPVLGAGHAPNLVRFLESHNIDVVAAPASRDEAMAAVRDGRHEVVVVIPETIGDDLGRGVPARIEVISDQANTTAEREARRASPRRDRAGAPGRVLRMAPLPGSHPGRTARPGRAHP